jgi:hypothetical protein
MKALTHSSIALPSAPLIARLKASKSEAKSPATLDEMEALVDDVISLIADVLALTEDERWTG